MPTTTPLTDAIEALTTYSNTVTGASDTTLSEAVATLAAGYGGGGSSLLYNFDFTTSLTDTVKGAVASLQNGCTRDSSGLNFTAINHHVKFDRAFPNIDVTYEIDIASSARQGTANARLAMITGSDGVVYRSTGYWGVYRSGGWQMATETDADMFSGKTAKIVYDSNSKVTLYCDNTLIYSFTTGDPWTGIAFLGGSGNSFYNMVITGMRIYKGDTTQS